MLDGLLNALLPTDRPSTTYTTTTTTATEIA